MRHQKSGRKFDRSPSSRRAMFRNLTANLVLHERIETTDAKAKELRRVAEKLVTKATRLGKVAFTPQDKLKPEEKAKRLHATRLVGSFITRFGTRTLPTGEVEKVDLVEKVFTDLAKRFQGRAGGYTRIIKAGIRRGDGAPMSLVEWVDRSGAEKSEKGEKPAKAEAKASEKTEAAKPAKAEKADKGEKKSESKTKKAAAAKEEK
jgi:large subunit ribosomal protein L17